MDEITGLELINALGHQIYYNQNTKIWSNGFILQTTFSNAYCWINIFLIHISVKFVPEGQVDNK